MSLSCFQGIPFPFCLLKDGPQSGTQILWSLPFPNSENYSQLQPFILFDKNTGNVSFVITLQKVAYAYIHAHTEFSVMVLLVLPICGQYQLVKMQHRSYPANLRTKHNLTYLFLIQKAENCLFISHTVTFSQSVIPYTCCSCYLLTLKAFFFLGPSRRTTKLP